MTRERTRHSENGRVYVEGTPVDGEDLLEPRGGFNPIGAIVLVVVLAVFVGGFLLRRSMREASE